MSGERDKIEQWIQGTDFVIRVEVDAILPNEWPWKPQLEPDALRFLDKVQDLANRGMINELTKLGEVYVRQTA